MSDRVVVSAAELAAIAQRQRIALADTETAVTDTIYALAAGDVQVSVVLNAASMRPRAGSPATEGEVMSDATQDELERGFRHKVRMYAGLGFDVMQGVVVDFFRNDHARLHGQPSLCRDCFGGSHGGCQAPCLCADRQHKEK